MKRFVQVMFAVLAVMCFIGSASAGNHREEAKTMVHKAIAFIKESGKDKALAEISNPKGKFVKGELYVFVFDGSGTTIAHGGNQKLVGKNMLGLQDSNGTYFVKDFLKTAKAGGGWTEYKWTNPVTKKIEPKETYVAAAGDLVVGCGYYK